MNIHRPIVPEGEVYYILNNERRRMALECLRRASGTATIRDLAEAVAREEASESPAPVETRDLVYVSLHQTHLPALQNTGIVDYDSETREITLLDDARGVAVYMEVVTRWGITWVEYYRLLGVVALVAITAALVGIPVISAIDPVLLASGFLVAFAVSTAYNLWLQRWALLRYLQR